MQYLRSDWFLLGFNKSVKCSCFLLIGCLQFRGPVAQNGSFSLDVWLYPPRLPLDCPIELHLFCGWAKHFGICTGCIGRFCSPYTDSGSVSAFFPHSNWTQD
uniref:Uncharacterized protein n=1 Tax=Anguilla anguilla TaxID=7936 RepID=A0A0E9RX18_ANGAN